ncbi:MAG: TRAP transporter substrate-binding protein [Actinomycetaceae bacterium]|nr:TRAP transporter substrate-binding protein [Actinomycetaceae bacterium]
MSAIKKMMALLAVMTLGLAGCANQGVANSADATAEKPMVLASAHNLSEQHVTSVALTEFAEDVNKRSEGRLEVKIYPNGQLGSETEVLEQLMAGVGAMTRVGAPGLAMYNEGYHTFGLPFVFEDEDHYYKAMDSAAMREFYESSADDGFIALTYYTSGARSFYTRNTPIRTPEDLRGMKIRVQNMRSQTDMMRALGGTPVVIPFGDIYTSLESGIIDGAESNETALTQSNHGEVAKVFSVNEHAMIPDMLVISTKVWDRLTKEDQQILVDAAIASTEKHKVAWAEAIDQSIEDAKEMGVEFVEDVDRAAFQDATSSMVDDYAKEYPKVADVLEIIEQAK